MERFCLFFFFCETPLEKIFGENLENLDLKRNWRTYIITDEKWVTEDYHCIEKIDSISPPLLIFLNRHQLLRLDESKQKNYFV